MGITLGTINSNASRTRLQFGSLTNSDEVVRRKATDAHLRCIDVMNATGSDTLKIWLGDGTNHPDRDRCCAAGKARWTSLSVTPRESGPDQRLLRVQFLSPPSPHRRSDWHGPGARDGPG